MSRSRARGGESGEERQALALPLRLRSVRVPFIPGVRAFYVWGAAAYLVRLMGFEITTRRTFSAAHQLRLYDGSLETLHGHNWVVRVTVGAEGLDRIGVVMDFHELDRQVEEMIGWWHNRHLNEMPEFKDLNPSTENVALVVAGKLRLPPGVRVVSVEVWETESNSAVYRP